MAGIVAIVGRPNVGKSTIFNRITKSRVALVDDRPGLTRDRIYGRVHMPDEDDSFALIDTGGFETGELYFQPFAENIVWHQTEQAIGEADLVVLILDAKDGIRPHDGELHRYLEAKGKQVMYVVNKCDGKDRDDSFWDFYAIGITELTAISAAHNRGIDKLRTDIAKRLKKMATLADKDMTDSHSIKIALVGRPNVGKSSILNRLIGEERSLVSDVAGTTRDAVDSPLSYNGRNYAVVDTAGLRRRARVSDKIESITSIMSLRAMERAHVVCLVINAADGLTDQDARIAGWAVESFRPLLIVVNKWDLIPNKDTKTANAFVEEIHRKLGGLTFLPVTFVSCTENLRIHKILSHVEALADKYRKRVETSLVNEELSNIVREHTPSLTTNHNKRIKFFFATQVKAEPPTIVAFCNVADEVQESYKRYMVNKFRERLGFEGIPLRLILRGKKEVREKKEAEA